MTDERTVRFVPMVCPFCGSGTESRASFSVVGQCICDAIWRVEGRIVTWTRELESSKNRAVESKVLKERLRRAFNNPNLIRQYIAAKASLFHPLQGWFSPLAAFTRRRLDHYYRRTLTDDMLAREWIEGFTQGLNLPERPMMLDHGCGRGRMAALAIQNGYRVYMQEIMSHTWWNFLAFEAAQVVPPAARYLPWPDGLFDLMLDALVIGHFERRELAQLATEAHRVIRSGGYWIILEANSDGYGADGPRKHYGRLHSLQDVKAIAAEAGFSVVDVEYEGFRSPILPRFVDYMRTVLWPSPLNLSDRYSFAVRMTPPKRRYLWRLRLLRD